jgi:peroxiredoxin
VTNVFYISYAALWALVVFQSLVVLGLARTVYQANARPVPQVSPMGDESMIGEPVPRFTAMDLRGTSIDEGSLMDSLSALLFVSPDCPTCTATLDEVNALSFKTDGNVLVVCRSSIDECARLAESYGLQVPVLLDETLEISERFGVSVTPTAVLVGSDGLVQSFGHPMRADELAQLMANGRPANPTEAR